MLLNKDIWNTADYNNFINYLHTLSDTKYKMFHSKLLKDNNIEVIGVKTPILKDIAKEISSGNYIDFIKQIKHNYYEEDVIYGLILGYLKIPFTEIITLLNDFTPYINNWATNDIVCANMKIFKKEQAKGLIVIKEYLNDTNYWIVRFGLVLLLDYYINDKYIDDVLFICKNLKHQEYYVLMAIAWLISICYIKYPNKTINLLKNGYLDDFTLNKSIQKIIESKRINKVDKNKLRKLKRSNSEK